MAARRVVVTGAGVISALGPDRQSFWDAISKGRSGIRPMQLVDRAQFRFQNGGEVPDYNPASYFDDKEIGLLDRFAQFGVEPLARRKHRDSHRLLCRRPDHRRRRIRRAL